MGTGARLGAVGAAAKLPAVAGGALRRVAVSRCGLGASGSAVARRSAILSRKRARRSPKSPHASTCEGHPAKGSLLSASYAPLISEAAPMAAPNAAAFSLQLAGRRAEREPPRWT